MRSAVEILLTALLVTTVVANATEAPATGVVTVTGIVSRYVELTSGGDPAISGHSGNGSANLNGPSDSDGPLSVTINMGEVGPANSADFVKAVVPLRIRSNAPYVLSVRTVSFSAGDSDVLASDIGFGLDAISRSLTGGVLPGSDNNHTAGDPSAAPANSSGRYQYTTVNGHLGAFQGGAIGVLQGARILGPVPRAGAGALSVDAIFTLKPQFFAPGSFQAVVDFVVAAP